MHIKLLIVSLFAIHCNAQNVIRIPSVRVARTENAPAVARLPVITTVTSDYGGNILPIASNRANLGNLDYGFDSGFLAIPANGVGPSYALLPTEAELARAGTLGLATGVTGGIPLGAQTGVLGPVIAAIITQRTAEVVDFPTPPEVITPQVLIVEPNQLPVTIEFRSQSSPVNVHQVHIPGPPGDVKATRSEEEPDRVLHEVVKPVIQEVREIIQPFRKITQEILPVQEEVHSVVARGEGIRQQIVDPSIPPPPAPAPGGIVTATVLERPAVERAEVVPVVAAPAVAPAVVAAAAGPVFATGPAVVAAPAPIPIAAPAFVAPAPINIQQASPFLTGTIVQSGTFGTRVIAVPGNSNGIRRPNGLRAAASTSASSAAKSSAKSKRR